MNSNDQIILTGSGITAAFEIVGVYEIYLEWTDGFQSVQFRVVEWTDGSFEFFQSHYLRLPDTTFPYRASARKAPTKSRALEQGVESIMREFNQARQRGEQPNAAWFVENDEY